MRKTIRLAVLALTIAAPAIFGACNQTPKEENSAAAVPVFNDPGLAGAYAEYIHLKDALVASDADAAQTAAVALQTNLQELPGAEKAAEAAALISGTADIAAQRKAFSELSNAFSQMAKASGLAEGEVYLAFCPMAENNAGAYWLASEREIRNPYFGDRMLKCGEVKETLVP